MGNKALEQLLFIENQCANAQDAIIIRLLMEGVEVHEIVYLTNDSLDPASRVLTIKNRSGITIRKILLTTKCVELFQNAANQSIYILNNGYNPISKTSINLRDSHFLIKVSFQDYIANECMITEMDSVILRAIYTRLKRLAGFFSCPELIHLTTVKLEEKAYA